MTLDGQAGRICLRIVFNLARPLEDMNIIFFLWLGSNRVVVHPFTTQDYNRLTTETSSNPALGMNDNVKVVQKRVSLVHGSECFSPMTLDGCCFR